MNEPGAPDSDRAVIAFAEKLLTLVEHGRFTATYKYAVLLALIDLSLEKTERSGAPPSVLTTRELAEKVIELYWPHAAPFPAVDAPVVLLQNASRRVSQAEILTLILRFRGRPEVAAVSSLSTARRGAPGAWERLVRNVEWKLIEMPLPRLQTLGGVDLPFLYRIAWDRTIERYRRLVRAYQDGRPVPFDNRILLLDGVADRLCRLSGLLRPLVQHRWAEKVARINGFEEARLKEFLFGAPRGSLSAVRGPLVELQEGRCFYCQSHLASSGGAPEVDHFIPWARAPDDGLENLVVAHRRCNAAKRDLLASADHVARWRSRGDRLAPRLDELARTLPWDAGRPRTLGVARGIYLRLPPDALLWRRGQELVPADLALLSRTLRAS